MKSWKPEIRGVRETSWSQNGLAFATRKEAEQWGFDLLLRWSGAEDYRAVESDEPVSHRIVNDKLEAVK
jgi:hypothetical protein